MTALYVVSSVVPPWGTGTNTVVRGTRTVGPPVGGGFPRFLKRPRCLSVRCGSKSVFVSVLSVLFLSGVSHLLDSRRPGRHQTWVRIDARLFQYKSRNEFGIVRFYRILTGSPKTEGRLALLCRAFKSACSAALRPLLCMQPEKALQSRSRLQKQ